MVSLHFNSDDFSKAIAEAQNPDGDARVIAALLPDILRSSDVRAASALLSQLPRNEYNPHWLPEAFALLGVQTCLSRTRREMTRQVFGRDMPLSSVQTSALANLSHDMAMIGFSFPSWRFVSMGFGDDPKALLEHAGMDKRKRFNDVRDKSLPRSNPQRDEFGTGFVWQGDDWRVEYRRAYAAISRFDPQSPAHLVIRNSSFFFGRDRIEAPVLVSFSPLSFEALDDLDSEQFADPDLFIPWQDIVYESENALELDERLDRVQGLVEFFDTFDFDLMLGLVMGNQLKPFIALMREQKAQHAARGKNGAPFYLGALHDSFPPWAPDHVMAVDEALIEALEAYRRRGTTKDEALNRFIEAVLTGDKPVLLSSAQGDHPVAPKSGMQKQQDKAPAPAIDGAGGKPDPQI